MHLSVFLYQYIILLASLIYFWRGVSRPQRPPLDLPLRGENNFSKVASQMSDHIEATVTQRNFCC